MSRLTRVLQVCQTYDMPEYKKLLFLKEIGYTHLRITQGVNSLLQLSGMLARLCRVSAAKSMTQ